MPAAGPSAIACGETELERVYRQVTALADRSKTVSDEQLAASSAKKRASCPTVAGGARACGDAGQAQGAACR